MDKQEQITVLVHGTFANEPAEPGKPDAPKWWRVTEDGLTAQRLQTALEQQDLSFAGSVWQPGQDPRDKDLTYGNLVEWSSRNKHKDRLEAAKQLTGSLRTLADRRKCTAERPLHVNYVAHSHGGNVVLESLKHLEEDDIVKPRQVSLLGTPLTWRHTDLRIGYLTILFAFFLLWVGVEYEYFRDLGSDPEAWALPGEIALSFLLMTGLLWLAFIIIRFFRRVSNSLPGKPAYGPKPKDLKVILGSRPVVLFISDRDEADLMLQLGAAPLDAYRAMVRGQPALTEVGFGKRLLYLPLRLVEVLFIRPFSYAILIPMIEILLERFGLGFPFRSVMVRNYEMTTWTKNDRYGQTIGKVQVEAAELRMAQMEADELQEPLGDASGTEPQPSDKAAGEVSDSDHIKELRKTLLKTIAGLQSQVHLSHSGYYQSQKIIDDVATVIAASDQEVVSVIASLKTAD